MSTLPDLPKTIEPIMTTLLASPVLDVPLRQRAKFENWLKIELGSALDTHGFEVCLEKSYTSGNGRTYRADIAATANHLTHLIMLKTVNTNFRFPDVESHSRPITKNIAGVIEDIGKLTTPPRNSIGYVLFPMFPVAANELNRTKQLQRHIDKITKNDVELIADDFVLRYKSWGLIWYLFKVKS